MEDPPENINDFVDTVFEDFSAKFQLVKKCTENTNSRKASTKPLAKETLKSIFARDEVLGYLAPHEILCLWQTCKSCQLSTLQRRLVIMMQSVFLYLRISQETASHVQRTYVGGWKTFLPRLVQMCDYLVTKVYGIGLLEPDLAHRTYLAEQACYDNVGLACSMGKLASYAYYNTTIIRGTNSDGRDDPIPVPSLADLMNVGNLQIGWGNPMDWDHPSFGSPGLENEQWFKAGMPQWMEAHLQWMQNQARLLQSGEHEEYNQLQLAKKNSATNNTMMMNRPVKRGRHGRGRTRIPPPPPIEQLAGNTHIQQRLLEGLHPAIWITYCIDSTPTETVFVVGPNLEQVCEHFSCNYDELGPPNNPTIESFVTCPFPTTASSSQSGSGGGGGIVEFLAICSPCCITHDFIQTRPNLAICIWFMRHNIPPFDNPTIQWESVIDAIIEEGQNNNNPPAAKFYKDALTAREFGPANLAEFTATLLSVDE